MNQSQKILVNATAARSSGALSILNQFIEIASNRFDYAFYFFVDPSINKVSNGNIIYIKKNTRQWFKRFCWDNLGFRNWIKKERIKPSLIISLQNTGVSCSQKTPQLIYYHQPLPLFENKWSFLKKTERKYFFYKHIYPFFIKLNINANTYFIVQIPFMKTKFAQNFQISSSKIFVIKPEIKKGRVIDTKIALKEEYIYLLYPATPLIYKNHILLLDALIELDKINPELRKKIKILFTFNEYQNHWLFSKMQRLGFVDNFVFLGILPSEELLSLYKKVNALLFPSYIESFGLPLIEGAQAGLPIVVSDLPYARDVLENYEGSVFVEYNNPQAWCTSIVKVCTSKKRYTFNLKTSNNSDDLFEIIKNVIKNHVTS